MSIVQRLKQSVDRSLRSKNPRTLFAHGIKIQKRDAYKASSATKSSSPHQPVEFHEPKKSIRLVKRNRAAYNSGNRVSEGEMLLQENAGREVEAALSPGAYGRLRISLKMEKDLLGRISTKQPTPIQSST